MYIDIRERSGSGQRGEQAEANLGKEMVEVGEQDLVKFELGHQYGYALHNVSAVDSNKWIKYQA